MTYKSFFLILQRQFTQKWGRFLLASGGIMIGVWAITLTSSLSFGLSDTIVKAINSQPAAKEFSLYKTPTNQTNFFEITEAPKFQALSLKQLQSIKDKYPEIVDIVPQNTLNFNLKDKDSKIDSCFEINSKLAALAIAQSKSSNPLASDTATIDLQTLQEEITTNCKSVLVIGNVWQNFYESNKNNWYGKTDKLGRGEIATCFKCGSIDFFKQFNVNDPKELLNKEVTLEYDQTPPGYEAGTAVDVTKLQRSVPVPKLEKVTFKIVSVIDDRDTNSFGGGNTNFYVDYSYFTDGIKLSKPGVDIEKVGFIQSSVYIRSYEDLDSILAKLKADNYLALSLVQTVIAGVKTAFTVLTAVLAGFGLIAMIASIFGIINVMTISVLERKKEIGILKSLGARDGDIFRIFLFESMSLGFIGWSLGTILSLIFGGIVSLIFKLTFNSNPDWKKNLESLNITEFSPSFPWWLLGGTLLLSLIFTVLSGVYPAIQAGKQNPVDVLRSE